MCSVPSTFKMLKLDGFYLNAWLWDTEGPWTIGMKGVTQCSSGKVMLVYLAISINVDWYCAWNEARLLLRFVQYFNTSHYWTIRLTQKYKTKCQLWKSRLRWSYMGLCYAKLYLFNQNNILHMNPNAFCIVIYS